MTEEAVLDRQAYDAICPVCHSYLYLDSSGLKFFGYSESRTKIWMHKSCYNEILDEEYLLETEAEDS